jgi:hypothetical protein
VRLTSLSIQDSAIINARLALDQFTFAAQVRSTTNFAKNASASLCGIDAPMFEDKEATLDDLIARIDAVVAFLDSLNESMVKDDLDTRLVALPWMPGKGLTVRYFVEEYSLMNFYFHYTTAYAILRHYGLQIGKGDFITNVPLKDLA